MDEFYLARAEVLNAVNFAKNTVGNVVIPRDEQGVDLGKVILGASDFTVVGVDGNTTFTITEEGLTTTFQAPIPMRTFARTVGEDAYFEYKPMGPAPKPVIIQHGKSTGVVDLLKTAADRLRNSRKPDRFGC